MKINFTVIIAVSVVIAGFFYIFMETSKIKNNIDILFKEVNSIKLRLEDSNINSIKYNIPSSVSYKEQPSIQSNTNNPDTEKKQKILDEIDEYERELQYLDSMIESEDINSLEKEIIENEDTTYIGLDNELTDNELSDNEFNDNNLNDNNLNDNNPNDNNLNDNEENIKIFEDKNIDDDSVNQSNDNLNIENDELQTDEEQEVYTDEEQEVYTDEEQEIHTEEGENYLNNKKEDTQSISTTTSVETTSIDKELLEKYVNQYSKKELVDMSKSLQISHSGNKETIIKRIYHKNKTLLEKNNM